MRESRRRGGTTGVSTAWTWVSGPSTHSGPFGHVTGAVQDAGGGIARIVILHASRDGAPRPTHVLREGHRLDDHIAPGIAVVGTSTLVAAFAGHGDDSELGISRLRIDDEGMVEDGRVVVSLPSATTYAHVLNVGDKTGRLLIITRSIDWSPTALWLDPQTLDVSEPFALIDASARSADLRLPGRGGRPYVVTRQLPGSALIALVHDHPSAYRNGVVAAELSEGSWQRLDGAAIRAIGDRTPWDPFEELETVVDAGGEWVPWVHDIARDDDGRTAVAWSERRRLPDGRAVDDIRYRVAELRAGAWHMHPPLFAGAPLYPGEPDYAGGITFAAGAIDQLLLVSSVNPFTGGDLSGRRRLYGMKLDGESRWAPTGSTEGHEDVMRPRTSASVAPAAGRQATWVLSGRYGSYREFDLRPRLTVHPQGSSPFVAPWASPSS